MAKEKSVFKCKECGWENPKWLGKCPSCGAWSSFEEQIIGAQNKHSVTTSKNIVSQTFGQVQEQLKTHPERRFFEFGSPMLTKFWNNGLVAGSFTLLAGEPGLGKSTFGLQLLRALYVGQIKPKLLYITAEESVFEIARRAERLGIPKDIAVLQSNNFEQIEKVLFSERPEIAIIDSMQTIYSSDIDKAPGSVSQVTLLASQMLAITKAQNIAIVLIGHVTKDGQIAGPKSLEHLVDSVLLLENADIPAYRTIAFSKHRFGSTSNQLLLKMVENGLEIVTDPSLALLENLETGVGVVYGLAIVKNMPLVVEIQALVSKPLNGDNAFGRRDALGLKLPKLNTILAIGEKYMGLYLKNRDIYIQITGLPSNHIDDSLDLAILLAIISSVKEKTIDSIFDSSPKAKQTIEELGGKTKPSKKPIFAGRLTLSGTLRVATQNEDRQKTAKQLGFAYNPQIEVGEIAKNLKV